MIFQFAMSNYQRLRFPISPNKFKAIAMALIAGVPGVLRPPVAVGPLLDDEPVPRQRRGVENIDGILFGGLEHVLFFHILGIIMPTDSDFSEGFKPPTRYNMVYTL